MRRFLVSFVLSLGVLSVGLVGPGAAIAQEATPAPLAATREFPISPDPTRCTGEEADVERLLGLWYDAEGTPVVLDPRATLELGRPATEVTLPIGERADDATRTAVIETVTGVFACFAAGDVLRAFALFTENLARQFGPEPGTTREDAASFLTMAPQSEAEGEESLIVAITDVMLLADGRVGAFVVERFAGEDSTAFAIFVQDDDRWLLDEVIEFSEPFDDAGEAGTPTP